MATSRPRRVSRARYTSPIAPLPIGDTISYGPRRVPAEILIGGPNSIPSGPSCSSWLEQDARREFEIRIDRALDRAHFVDPLAAVEVAQELLLERRAAAPVFGKRTAAQSDRFAPEVQNRLTSRQHVFIGAWNHVRMNVAVGTVSPDGVIKAAALIAGAINSEEVLETIEWHDHVAGGLVDARVDQTFGVANAAVDAERRGLAQREQLLRAPDVAGHRQFRAIERVMNDQQLNEPPDRRVPPGAIKRRGNILERAVGRRPRRQFELDDQQEGGLFRNRDRVSPIGAVFTQHLQAAPIEMFDGRDIDAVSVLRSPGRLGGRAQFAHERDAL